MSKVDCYELLERLPRHLKRSADDLMDAMLCDEMLGEDWKAELQKAEAAIERLRVSVRTSRDAAFSRKRCAE